MRRLLLLSLMMIAWGSTLKADNAFVVLPQATAMRFCRLMVCDGDGKVTPLHQFVRRHQALSADTLTIEQLFCLYVFSYGGWQTLRIFPHQEKGSVTWYAPGDALPSSLDAEHQKFIREALVRLGNEAQAGHWENVNAFIDRLTQYQCTFGASVARPNPRFTPYLLLLLVAGLLLVTLAWRHRRNTRKPTTGC